MLIYFHCVGFKWLLSEDHEKIDEKKFISYTAYHNSSQLPATFVETFCLCVCVLWIGLFEPNYLDREKSRVESNDQFASVPYCLRENVYASVCICLS